VPISAVSSCNTVARVLGPFQRVPSLFEGIFAHDLPSHKHTSDHEVTYSAALALLAQMANVRYFAFGQLRQSHGSCGIQPTD
jgi:hypothetical protein